MDKSALRAPARTSAPKGLDKREVCRRYEGGEDIVSIAASLSVSHVAIHKIVTAGGCERRSRRRLPDAKIEAICAARGTAPARIIASQHGMSMHGIYRAWRRHGEARA